MPSHWVIMSHLENIFPVAFWYHQGRGGCRRASDPDYLAYLHKRALPAEVSRLPAPPALLTWCLRNPLPYP